MTFEEKLSCYAFAAVIIFGLTCMSVDLYYKYTMFKAAQAIARMK
jgi:hypothetical protein